MPTAPPTRCSADGCTELTTTGRCDEHKRKPWQQRSRHQPRGRLARRDVAFKAEHLRVEPNCRSCGRPAEQVDHILPLAKGGAMFNHANAQSLCGPCHDVKTRAENAARNRSGARHAGGGGWG
ncbi:HNH endonuclease [Saccharopolyspora shandongensis]|uniref:HNH endonuclease n=1 Tax=Saccharopolyspora shandongensis TaxID=418495 RepID=UPI0015A6FC0A